MKPIVKYILAGLTFCILTAGIVVYLTMFRLSPSVPTSPATGRFLLRNVATGQLLRPLDAKMDNDTPMEVFAERPWTCVGWNVQQQNNRSFLLVNYMSGKTFKAGRNRKALQSPIQGDGSEQVYHFIPVGSHAYRIASTNNLSLTVLPGNGKSQPEVSFQVWHNSPHQQWEVIRSPEKLIGPTVFKP